MDQCLHTEIGALVLAILPTSSMVPSAIAYQKPRCQGYGLSSDGMDYMLFRELALAALGGEITHSTYPPFGEWYLYITSMLAK